MISGLLARARFKEAIRAEFQKVVTKHKGALDSAAHEIGVTRQALQQYADGCVPAGDILLAAMAQLGVSVQIEDPSARQGELKSWRCSIVAKHAPCQQPKPEPKQLPLFQAIDDLNNQHVEVKILRKRAASIRLGVEIAFPKRML